MVDTITGLPLHPLVIHAAVAGTSRNRTLGPIAVVASIVSSVLAVWWCIRTGDAGARSVWGS